jgi:hypothetical protein
MAWLSALFFAIAISPFPENNNICHCQNIIPFLLEKGEINF